jgi:hypothetical protein
VGDDDLTIAFSCLGGIILSGILYVLYVKKQTRRALHSTLMMELVSSDKDTKKRVSSEKDTKTAPYFDDTTQESDEADEADEDEDTIVEC